MVSTSVTGRAIFEFSTKELVDELSKREGVERIDVAPHTQMAEICVKDFSVSTARYPGGYVEKEVQVDGPCILLKIID